MTDNARIGSINTSSEKGDKKSPVADATLIAGFGIEGDAHAGAERQSSLLARESIEKAISMGVDLRPGDFGENITTEGFDLAAVRIGERLRLGPEAIVQISDIGKVCETPCSIGQRLGDCIMPREGVFAKVMRGGRIAVGDTVASSSVKVGAVLTSSDRCAKGERQDESGRVLVALLNELEIALADYTVMPDEEAQLSAKMKYLADRCAVDLILTTGGTGFTPRDRMPEATLAVLDSQSPGISEAIRAEGMRHTLYACLSRGVSGLRGRTLIINLPGSKRAVEESLDLLRAIIPHVLSSMRMEIEDCGKMERPAAKSPLP
ncbi:MAG: molybdopterin-binding protein [Armatimonadota bacterium]|nr:molybdopterin-binding protein [Armatimonadota bacterium]